MDIRDGNACELPVEDSSTDAIVCAQVTFSFLRAELIVGVSLVCNCGRIERICQSS